MEHVLNLNLQKKESPDFGLSLCIQPTSDELRDLCFALMWLKHEIIEAFVPSEQEALRITKLTKKQSAKILRSNSAYAIRMPDGLIELRIREALLDDWLHYFLRFAYDSVGEVDHVNYTFYSLPQIPSSLAMTMTISYP